LKQHGYGNAKSGAPGEANPVSAAGGKRFGFDDFPIQDQLGNFFADPSCPIVNLLTD
jgi:hypothetical protein